MNTPPFLLGITLLFWGWQAGFLWLSVAAAIVIEGSRLFTLRWVLSGQDLKRVVYLCDLLLAGGFVYAIFTTGMAGIVDAIMYLLRALPLAILPLIIAQAYSTGNQIDINVLMLFSKKTSVHKEGKPPRPVDLSYPYFAVCLLSAGAANVRTPWFYAGFSFLLAWALWVRRPKTFTPVIWVMLLVPVGAAGYIGHIKLHDLQAALQDVAVSFFTQGEAADAYKSKTAVGRIGELKLSDRILIRVKAGTPGRQAPFLLQDAGYDSYAASTWFARGSVFQPVKPERNGTSWNLHDTPVPKKSMSISAYLSGGKGILVLPRGTSHIENLQVGEMKQSGLGTVTVDEGPKLVNFLARFDPDAVRMAAPKDIDLKVPRNMTSIFLKIVDDLGLKAKSPNQVVQAVTGYFNDNFQYSTYKKDIGKGLDPVEDFLLRSRAGHCEYFATATVLLLRASGIPARYSTGYSVQEFSELEGSYIVRSKHAHAWALAYVDGAWRDVDTTPPSWFDVEKSSSGSRVLSDLWSWLVFKLSGLLRNVQDGGFAYYIIWIAAPVVVIFVWKLYFKKRVFTRKAKRKQKSVLLFQMGKDSEFYAIQSELARRGLDRQTWEPLNIWIDRICFDIHRPDLLKQIISLHYRYRFDPDGLSQEERETLKDSAREWFAGMDGR
ncbi:MAG TPA: transglutaminase-like domain-containing protein [Syntrophorhabdaceae bacterium]|nr:transglutaminase-like domain-containing protein [Syntrophorhabdaceae bacterium]